ncbi:MAG: hypothetical protein E7635_05440 [Ruminococcaceae bacterium]|nr:hypothetical protein [Oscillospiraceae bacterium]
MENKKKRLLSLSCVGISVILLIIACVFCALYIKHNRINQKLESEIGFINIKLEENASLLASANDRNRELEKELEGTKEYYLGYYEGIIAKEKAEKDALGENYDELKEELERQKGEKGFDISELESIISSIETLAENGPGIVRVKRSEDEIKKLFEETGEDVFGHKWVSAAEFISDSEEKFGKEIAANLPLSYKLAGTEADAPNIAVYYEDLTTGYKYSYNGDKIFDSASVMKAPYITSILKAASEFENGELEASLSDEKYSVEALEEMFVLDDKIVLDLESMSVDGSGVLKNANDGDEFSYTELMGYALKNSDNIAFSLVKDRFTSKWYFDFVREVGAYAPLSNSVNMTVRDAGKLFSGIYSFTLDNEKYGSFVKDSLTDSAHKVLSQSVFGKEIVHKYGWDENAYHDAAIIYGEHPYIAIVFTDMDCGGADTDKYIREIFKKIKELHEFLN